jgi:hypothetical protein
MKRSENSHERIRMQFSMLGTPHSVKSLLFGRNIRRNRVFHLVCVVEERYTTARMAVSG